MNLDKNSHIDSTDLGKKTPNLKKPSLLAIVEGIIFASEQPISIDKIKIILKAQFSNKQIKLAIQQLVSEYDKKMHNGQTGICLKKVYDGYHFQTIDELSDIMQSIFGTKPPNLSKALHETLAIIAYRQPVTRSDIEYIRGVDVGNIIKKLLEKELIQVKSRKEIPGRPLLFSTTTQFLKAYQLNSLADLPKLSSFQPSVQKIQSSNELIKKNTFDS